MTTTKTCVLLLQRIKSYYLPDEELANNFIHFFSDKISQFRDGFDLSMSGTYAEPETVYHCLMDFTLASKDEIFNILCNSSVKFCELDPICILFERKCFSVIIPYATNIINHSLESRIVPDNLKIAHVHPLLKKKHLITIDQFLISLFLGRPWSMW